MSAAAESTTTPIALHQGEGEARWFLGCLVTIKASTDTTRGRVAVIEHVAPEGDRWPGRWRWPGPRFIIVLLNTSRRLPTISSIFAFACGRELGLHVLAAEGVTERLIGRDEAPAPARLLFRCTGEHRREPERLVDERRAELRCAATPPSSADTPSSRRADASRARCRGR